MNPHLAPITARLNMPLIWRWNAENERAIRVNRGRPKREVAQDWRDRTLARKASERSVSVHRGRTGCKGRAK